MIDRFGPWSSALGDNQAPGLDTFWKRRLTMLATSRSARRSLRPGERLCLGLAALAALAVPTLHLANADSRADDRPAGTGKIYARANFNAPGEQDGALSGLFAIDPDTATRTKLADDNFFHVRVAPDGRQVALSKSGWSGPDRPVEDAGVWIIDAAGTTPRRRIADFGGTLSWSPDSKQLLVTKGLTPSGFSDKPVIHLHETWRLNADGSGAAKTPIPASEEVDDWSPDGQWVVTVSDRQEPKFPGYQLYVMHPDGSGERLISDGTGLNVYPRFSPDGRQVAYLHSVRGVAQIEVVNVDGSDRRVLVRAEGLLDPDHLAWSPNGKQIVYRQQTAQLDPKDGHKFWEVEKTRPKLVIIDLAGRPVRTVATPPAKWLEAPDWR